jgi:cysteinyl-tRNA synthetase
MHNNMLTINGQKMGKSLGNFITLEEFFTGNHPLLDRAYSPMTIRFFTLQAHYRSTLDFSNEALQAAQKGMDRLLKTIQKLPKLAASPISNSTEKVELLEKQLYAAMNDDLNTPVAIAHLFEAVNLINAIDSGEQKITEEEKLKLFNFLETFTKDILGITLEASSSSNALNDVVGILVELRNQARKNKDFATSDKIRDQLTAAGITIKDGADGTTWEF